LHREATLRPPRWHLLLVSLTSRGAGNDGLLYLHTWHLYISLVNRLVMIYITKKGKLKRTLIITLNEALIQLPREVMTKAAALPVRNNQQIINIKKPRQPQQQVQAPVRAGTSDLVTNKNKTRTRGGAEPHQNSPCFGLLV
jgi:hypothetical protein